MEVWLSVSESSDDLGNSEPEILVNVVSSKLYELDDDIDVPVEIFCKFLGEDSHLEHNFLLKLVVVLLKVIKDFVDDLSCHLRVTEAEEGVERDLSDGNIFVSQVFEENVHKFFDELVFLVDLGASRHCL